MPKRQPAVRVQIPTLLADSVKNKRAILFLGAGASKEAKNAAGQTPPDADQLRDILAQRFFGQPMKTRDVMAVAEMAIASSGGYGLVFNEVRQAFEGFQPSKAHKLISAFNWRAIATTNYDLLVEKAYSDSPQRLQTLVPFVKDDQPIEEKLQATIYPVQYLKLHGCLDHILDPDIPLILSREQYNTYSDNRTRLFTRLQDYARESEFLHWPAGARSRTEFAADSPLEEAGFELSVPPERKAALDRVRGPSVIRRQASLIGRPEAGT